MTDNYQQAFVQLALAEGALRFGEFTLKSGRHSPYFFNAGEFHHGAALAALGRFYAQAIIQSGVAFDMLFGPAYKGIPLASATAIALAEQFNRDVPFCFNRKEAKDHGEGGNLVGAPLRGRVLIIDDVITAGTAIGEVMTILQAHNAQAAGVVVGLDRREKGEGALSAVQTVEAHFGIPVASIIDIRHILAYLEQQPGQQRQLAAIQDYMARYGI